MMKHEENPIPVLVPLVIAGGVLAAVVYFTKKAPAAEIPPSEAPVPMPPEPEKTPGEIAKEYEKKIRDLLPPAASAAAAFKALGITGAGIAPLILPFAAIAAAVTAIAFTANRIHTYRKAMKHRKELKTQAVVAAEARVETGKQLRELRIANSNLLREIICTKDQLAINADEEFGRWKAYQALIPIDYWNILPADVPKVEQMYVEAYLIEPEGMSGAETDAVFISIYGGLLAGAISASNSARKAKKKAKEMLLLLLGHLHYLKEAQGITEVELVASSEFIDKINSLGGIATERGVKILSYEEAKKAGIFSDERLGVGVSGMMGVIIKDTGLKTVVHYAPTREGRRNPEVMGVLRSNLDKILGSFEARIITNVNKEKDILYFGKTGPALLEAAKQVRELFAKRDMEIKRLSDLRQLLDAPDVSKAHAIFGDLPHANMLDWEKQEIVRLMNVSASLPTTAALLKAAPPSATPVTIVPAPAPAAAAALIAPSAISIRAMQGFFENVTRKTMY